MKLRTAAFAFALTLVAGVALAKGNVWEGKPEDWTLADTQDVLNKSPWVQTVKVTPGALKAKGEATDKPTSSNAPVGAYVRWASSGVLRQAIARAVKLSGGASDAQLAEITKPSERFYTISFSVPDSMTAVDSIPFTELKEKTTLTLDDGTAIPLINVIPPKDNRGQEADFLFDHGKPIPDAAKKATFHTQLNDVKVDATFELDKMVVGGKRDLDGDLAPVAGDEKIRREIQTAVLDGADENMKRALSDLRTEKKPDPKRPWGIYVFYDPSRELANPAEATAVDVVGRKQLILSRIGKWSNSNKDSVAVVVFVDTSANPPKAADFMTGQDTEKLAKLDGDAAKKFTTEHLQKPQEKKADAGGKPK